MESEDRKLLKKLIKKYRVKGVKNELDNIKNEHYLFWKSEMELDNIVSETIPKTSPEIIPETVEKKVNKQKTVNNLNSIKQIKIIKSNTVQAINNLENTTNELEETPTESRDCRDTIIVCPDTHEICPDTSHESDVVCTEKKSSSSEIKRIQREKEAAKREELDKKGITIESLLITDNLKKWIEEEGRTYAFIAREYAGCSEDKVSAVAKALGIQSKLTAKKRAIMYSKK